MVTTVRVRVSIAAILALGAILRFWTIGSGVPHTVGVDEPEILRRVVHMMKTGDLNPHFFDYGGLILYFHLAVATGRFVLGAMGGDPAFRSLDQIWEGPFYLWARYATAFVGTLIIYVVYRAGLRWGARVALVAAMITAIHPNLVREAHFALTDTPLTFFVALALLLSLIASETGRVRWFAAAGAAAGLAAAIKYNGALALAMPLAVAAVSPAVRLRVPAALGALGAAPAAFLIAAPYSLLALPEFLGAFAYLATSYNQSRAPSEVAGLYVTYLRNGFGLGPGWHLFGWIGLSVSLAGVVVLLGQLMSPARRAAAAAVLAFSAVYFWLISHQSLVYARYALPLLPMLALALAVGFWRLTDAAAGIAGPTSAWRSRQSLPAEAASAASAWRRRAAVIVLLAATVPPLWQSVSFDWNRRKIGTDETMARWLTEHLSPEDPILIETPTIVLPPPFQWDYTHWLIDEPLETYQERGVRYLVASSERSKARPDAYRRLFESTQILMVVPQTDAFSGPTLTVLQVPQR
jgi:hypothetical protein